MVLDVANDKGLHREIMDLMRFQTGAGYAKEFDELRKKGLSLQQIVDYFLQAGTRRPWPSRGWLLSSS